LNKKILVIAPSSYIGGAEIVTLDIITALKNNGFDLKCIIKGWNNGDFPNRLNKLGVDYVPIKLGWFYLKRLSWTLDSFVNFPYALWQFLKVKLTYKWDIIYLTSYRELILLFPFLNGEIIYHVHSSSFNKAQSRFFIKIIQKKVNKFIAVSNFIKSDLIRCGVKEEKIVVVHNGVDVVNFPSRIEKNNSFLNIGIVGQVIERKGHEDVIDALEILLKKDIKKFKLKIVGRGDRKYEEKLKLKIKKLRLDNFVDWTGFKNEKKDIYEDIDLLIAPTRNEEPFAMVPLEAGAYEIPSIVTNVGGFPEMIVNGETGFIVNPKSAHEIAEKFEILIMNNDLRKYLALNAKERINKLFNKKKMVMDVLNYFKD
jgi:glycosyltransferase involved in cell wall biosynthesis